MPKQFPGWSVLLHLQLIGYGGGKIEGKKLVGCMRLTSLMWLYIKGIACRKLRLGPLPFQMPTRLADGLGLGSALS